MTVYVDDMRITATVGKHSSRWSHLTADSSEELLAFALALGLRQSWVQYPGSYKEHYDLTEGMRQRALRTGAVAITIQEAGGLLQAKRAKLKEERLAD